MKLILRLIAVTVLMSTVILKTSDTYPVRAKKLGNQLQSVTVKITDQNEYLIKESTFRRNTDGRVGKLAFDFSKGPNTITAYFKDEKFGLSIPSQDDAPEGSEIVIDTNKLTVTIDKSKAKKTRVSSGQPHKESILVDVVSEDKGNNWSVISGTNDLRAEKARAFFEGKKVPCGQITAPQNSDSMYPEILGVSCFDGSGAATQILIYKTGFTRIYAEKPDGKKGKITILKPDVVKSSGSSPVIIIGKDGNAKIMSAKAYVDYVDTTKLWQPAPAPERAPNELTKIPEHIDLKSLLVSKNLDDFKQRYHNLYTKTSSGGYLLHENLVSELMKEPLDRNLLNTPYVLGRKDKDAEYTLKEPVIKRLQASYDEIYDSLHTTDKKIPNKSEVKMFYSRLTDLLNSRAGGGIYRGSY